MPATPIVAGQLSLSIQRLRHRYGNGTLLDLEVPLELSPGQAAIVTGPSGSGKSTLLRALGRCLPEDGETTWWADVLPERSTLVLQDPEAQLLCSTVEEEVAFGLHNQGIGGAELTHRVDEALDAMEIAPLAGRNVENLSTGQKQRVVLAALLALRPSVLLLDEPFSQLDAFGQQQLRTLILRQKAEGRTVIASAHRAASGDSLWDSHIDLPGTGTQRLIFESATRLQPASAPAAAPAISYSVEGFHLALPRGSTTHVLGDNASGKTTLLRSLAAIATRSSERPPGLAGRVGYLPQNADSMLFEETVEREVGFAFRHLRMPAEARKRRVEEALALCGLRHLALASPLCLSHGERHVVALASVIASRPPLLLLDEPFTGLDDRVAQRMLAVLDACASAGGTAVVLASHNPLPRPWGDQRLTLRGGCLNAFC